MLAHYVLAELSLRIRHHARRQHVRLVALVLLDHRLHLRLGIHVAIQLLLIQVVEHILPLRVPATLVVALDRRIGHLLHLIVLRCVLRVLPPVGRHAAFLAISYHILRQT